jgi:hypothetical protein
MCGATALTPPTLLQPTEGHLNLHFQAPGAQPGFLGMMSSETFAVDRASVCLECGHVILGLSPERLQELRAKGVALHPTT